MQWRVVGILIAGGRCTVRETMGSQNTRMYCIGHFFSVWTMLFHGLKQFNFIFFFPAWWSDACFAKLSRQLWKYPLSDESRRSFAGCAPIDIDPIFTAFQDDSTIYIIDLQGLPLKHGVPMLIRLMKYNIHQYSSNDACYVILWTWRHAVWTMFEKELKIWNRVSFNRAPVQLCLRSGVTGRPALLFDAVAALCCTYSWRLTGAFACKWPVGIITARYWTS